MPLGVYVGQTILKNRHFEACLQQVFGRVAHTVFRGDAAHNGVMDFHEFQYFRKALPGLIDALEAAVLFFQRVLSLVKA